MRTGTPIYVSDAVIAEVGFVDGAEPGTDDQPEEMVEEFKEFRHDLAGRLRGLSEPNTAHLARTARRFARRVVDLAAARRTIRFVTST